MLNRLGHEILSFGKNKIPDSTQNLKSESDQFSELQSPPKIHSGNGIALFNAHKELSENGAQLIIHSIQNQGCEIKIIISTILCG